MDIFSVPLFLFVILINAAPIAGIVLIIRRAKDSESLPGIGTTRRLFLYGLAFISLMLATSGVTMLIASVLQGIFDTSIGRGDSSGQTAFGLAATIVGFPIWLLLMRAGSKSLIIYPSEAGTLGRKFYAYGVMMVSAIVVAFTATQILSSILGFDNVEVSGLAAPLVWASVWYFHWRTESREGQASIVAITVKHLYVYLTSAYSLIMLAVSVSFLLHSLLADAYASLFFDSFRNAGMNDLWGDQVRASAAVAIIGGFWWWFHWHRATDGDHTSELRVAAVYVLGIFGGLAVTVSGISLALFSIIKWLIARESGVSSAAHFDALPAAAAVTIAGLALWTYHRIVSQQDSAKNLQRSLSGNRVYGYLSAAVGLVTMAIGFSILVGLIVGLMSVPNSNIIIAPRWWGSPLAAAFTSMIVGGSLWLYHWLRRQAAAGATDPTERSMLSRRAYMFSVFGIAVLASLISASVVLFHILEGALERDLSRVDFYDVRWGLGIVASAAVVSAYHWQVMKEDRTLEPESQDIPTTQPKQITAVSSIEARPIVTRIASQINATVTYWERQDDAGIPVLTNEQASLLASEVSTALGEHVLLVVDSSRVQVIPL